MPSEQATPVGVYSEEKWGIHGREVYVTLSGERYNIVDRNAAQLFCKWINKILKEEKFKSYVAGMENCRSACNFHGECCRENEDGSCCAFDMANLISDNIAYEKKKFVAEAHND